MPSASPIPHHWQVPRVFRDRMGTTIGRQRTMAAEGHLLVILHDIPDPEAPERRDGKLFWRKPDGSWESSGGGPPSIAPMRAHVESYLAAADRLEKLEDAADEADDWFGLVYGCAPVLRSARNMARALQEARDAASDKDVIAIRDLAGDVERALELIYQHAREGLEYTIAKNAEEQSKSTQHVIDAGHRLNLMAALFLPVTAAGSLLGMNLEHGFEKAYAPWLFWAAAALCFVLGWAVRASLPKPPPPSSRARALPK